MKEQIGYRTRKWATQQLSSRRNADQFARLHAVDWDILVVLDACRADVLRDTASWPVQTAVSPASCTPEWLRAIASCELFADTHILSGNPQYEKVGVKYGCKTLEPFWETHWESTLQTTLPEPMLNRVDEVIDDATGGVVAHLQQPHWPYVAKLGGEWMLACDKLGPWSVSDGDTASLQVAMQRGLIDIEKAKQAYKASIRSVWKTLSEYLSQWVDQGHTIVVTADHGETFGRFREFGFYEHPCGCHVPPLVNVPWIELRPPKKTQADKTVENRLRALGYAE